ncbi:MAG: group III truncated hemoglobin, partial [Phycisphaerae bacterium]|nr:group III truncated hemoglobin [Phycisphaerae bacterium]
HVSDWSLHLPKMYDFWSTVVLHSGRYSGRPIEAHLRIPGLSARHFARWLTLWESTVDRVIGRPRGDAFVIAARRMAASMASRVLPAGDEE